MSLPSNGKLLEFYPLEHLDRISTRPVLFILSENANSLYFSQDPYAKAPEPKELYIVQGATHVDLDDWVEVISWDKLTSFVRNEPRFGCGFMPDHSRWGGAGLPSVYENIGFGRGMLYTESRQGRSGELPND